MDIVTRISLQTMESGQVPTGERTAETPEDQAETKTHSPPVASTMLIPSTISAYCRPPHINDEWTVQKYTVQTMQFSFGVRWPDVSGIVAD